MKYEYGLHTWGGFYNKEFSKIHGHEEGYHYFDSLDQHKEYLDNLKKISEDLNAKVLMYVEFEGYHCRTKIVLHRVVSFENKEYYSHYEMPPYTTYEEACWYLENKWYPGFNDYPLGEDFDYENKIIIVKEWITGSFDVEIKTYDR